MKYLKALTIHTLLWSGIVIGVQQGNSAVANLLGVAVFLITVLTVIVSLLCHWVMDTEAAKLAEVFEKSSLGTVGNFTARASALGIAVVLIIQGNGWLILGTMWLIALLLLASVVVRANLQVDTAAV